MPLRICTWALSTALASPVLAVALALVADEISTIKATAALVFLFIPFLALLALLVFYTALGTLAYRMRLSVPIWVGLPFLTSPIGPVVAYLLMRGKIADKSRAARK